ncbi:threonine/serine dehydratase [Hoeflea sp. Naph1]|uniref:threonine ammonia-lyase n=1 Tax=Hoeflea sp. Naph1 TaxID=3388653 RepID=UPI0039902A01
MISLDDIRAAAQRIAPHIRHTPVLELTAISDPVTEAQLFLKLENLQCTGSFKARGATNKLLSQPPGAVSKGIVTASGGNHGLAVARAARSAGVPATVYVTESATEEKREKLRRSGAEVKVLGKIWNEANEAALEQAERTGAAYFHPFADPMVVAGQGTVALEFLDAVPNLDTVIVAIGGGGLISGMSVALKALNPAIRIIGIEPEGSPTLKASLDAGRVVRLESVTSKVATMSCGETDPGVFALVRDNVDEIVLISDAEMEDAAAWLWFELGIAADLSGASAIAALRSGKISLPADARAGALVCGAGLDGVAL